MLCGKLQALCNLQSSSWFPHLQEILMGQEDFHNFCKNNFWLSKRFTFYTEWLDPELANQFELQVMIQSYVYHNIRACCEITVFAQWSSSSETWFGVLFTGKERERELQITYYLMLTWNEILRKLHFCISEVKGSAWLQCFNIHLHSVPSAIASVV